MIQPRAVPPPGEILVEEFLKPGGLTQAAVAAKLGWTPARLNQVAKGRRAITADSALDLAAFFRTSPQFWMNLQSMYDVDRALARRSRAGRPYPHRTVALVAAEPRPRRQGSR